MTMISRLIFFREKRTLSKVSERIITNNISIVIPVKNNQQGIENYLDAFFKSHSKNNYPKEIVIIDNNSSSKIVIPKRYTDFGLTIKLLSCSKKGPGAARNFGAQHTTGNWILFNDSDCIPTETLLSGYLAACNNSIAYAGNVKSLNQDRLSRYYESQEILIPLKTYDNYGSFAPQYLITANSLIWKEAFSDVNGFNENIKIAGGEDVDLGLRLSQVGNLNYAFESIVKHNFNDGWLGFSRRLSGMEPEIE